MIDSFPLSFFLPLVVHALAGMTTAVCGVVTFSRPKRRGAHPKWGGRYLWSYTVLWTAFYVDNAHLIPGLKELPTLTFWVLPTAIALPFLVVSLSRFAPKTVKRTRLDSVPKGGR